MATYEASTRSLPDGLIEIAPTDSSTLIDSDVRNVGSWPAPALKFMVGGLRRQRLGVAQTVK